MSINTDIGIKRESNENDQNAQSNFIYITITKMKYKLM